VGPLALVIAVGVARGLEGIGVETGLKWPNDVQLGSGGPSGKLAGILLEMAAEGDAVQWVVAGVGVNVRRSHETPPGAACVSDMLPDAGVARVAAAALDGIAGAYELWRTAGFGGLREEFEARSVLTGEPVVVRDLMGEVRARGVVTGVDREGRLLVEEDAGIRAIVAGEVTLRG
jgi:BirA family biotin operon repressor/biotin-[acetyl-CoA-carboxylase] ligase